jgi:alpha-beta hydrolase superfamily lysophospholipase
MELVYSLRTGIDLGPELGSVVQSASKVSVPVLIIAGGSDWIVPPSQAQQLLAALPVADRAFVEIPNAGHDTTFSTNPELYQKAVLAFLDANVPH